MEYRNLGKSGLKVSELSFGSWITFGKNFDFESAKEIIHICYDNGINFFDNAEAYASGKSEIIMGEAIKDLRREDLIISTKIFWGGPGPNDTGLSWKHLVEGTKNSLKRLQLDYVDLLFCHRPDLYTPIEETVRAMDMIIRSGQAFYWGTSEWSADQIEQAYQIARDINAIPPTMEQSEYNMFHRDRIEVEYNHLFKKYGMGATIWSPLESGILTGKYNQGFPKGSRLDEHIELRKRFTNDKIPKLKALEKIAKEIDCTLAQLAIAWCLKNHNVSSVITGATNKEQLLENLKSKDIKDSLNNDIMKKIQNILQGSSFKV